MQEDMETEARISQPTVFTSLKKHKGNATAKDNHATEHRSAALLPELQPPSSIDGRLTNRGARQQQRSSARFKLDLREEVEEVMNKHKLSSPLDVFRKTKKDNIGTATALANQYHKWAKDESYKKKMHAGATQTVLMATTRSFLLTKMNPHFWMLRPCSTERFWTGGKMQIGYRPHSSG